MIFMRFPQTWVLLGTFLGISSQLLGGEIVKELTPAQVAEVKKGGQVVLTEEIEGKPWPRVRVFQLIKATPEEACAVFTDYANAKEFVPNLLKSEVARKVSSSVAEVDYGLDVPILPDEFYTVRNTIKFSPPDSYRVDWKLLRAVQTKDSVGAFRVESFDGQTLLCYQNLVTPGSSMAPLLKGHAIKQMRQTVDAIVRQIEKQKTSNAADLKRQVDALRDALQ